MADKSMERIAQMLSEMKFKKKFIGGVSEMDVWKKLELLQKEYTRLYELQAQRYEAIIEHIKSGENHE